VGDEVLQDAAWDELCRGWAEACHESPVEAERWMQAARQRVARYSPDDWRWLADALADPARNSFVALVFKFQAVPKRLMVSMVRAAVMSRNASAGRVFVTRCVESLGARRVLELLLRYMESGTDAEKAGAVSAVYYAVHNPRGEEVDGLRERIRCWMLREFIENPDLDLRRRIIPSLQLEPEAYPQELRPLVPAAIGVARSHPDPYIRHRVEVQLGAEGPLLPIPPFGAG
jgi:hypothetical protein